MRLSLNRRAPTAANSWAYPRLAETSLVREWASITSSTAASRSNGFAEDMTSWPSSLGRCSHDRGASAYRGEPVCSDLFGFVARPGRAHGPHRSAQLVALPWKGLELRRSVVPPG